MIETKPFDFIGHNQRDGKPRSRGITEIRGPYYSVVGKRYLEDLFEGFGEYVDSLKFAAGSFSLMPEKALTGVIELCHAHDVKVSTGGWIEHVLRGGPGAVERYLEQCKRVGFDIVELSTGFISMPGDDVVRLTEAVKRHGLLAKPEVGIQFGAGGASSIEALEAEGTNDPGRAIEVARRCLDAGAYMVMIESEGITEQVRTWRTDVVGKIISALGTEKVMFEAADPAVFAWYVKTYGADVNLFVDHSQIVQLECLRRGIWGTTDTWGRVLTYRPE
ncbi:MAG TPA: phosphosulfolactate synthase [Candidatus Dormibacteraeota bacterium]|nr:phosphosulfolactate synthase [Candidatus Dormibacteraeota bacterium]